MYTDMVGYTALGQRNEPLSLAIVEEQRKVIRPVLARHNGREVKTMGDAFLVEFPNAVDAVRCAYDIQRAVRDFNLSLDAEKRIHLRIGIHAGEVVESQGDILGDAVNVASRIEPLAEDGGVCVTARISDLVSGRVDLALRSLGLRALKNVAAPTEVFKMIMPWDAERARETLPLDAKKIAILPFANFSPDPNDAYFADGITEEIISTVSGIGGLSVISRTSVMGYKGTTKKMKEIGKELEVGSILEGSFRKAGNKIRITTQLIDVANDRHLWAQNYDRNLDDVFEVQSDIAQRVAGAMKVSLLDKEKEGIAKAPTTSISAYESYLRGLSLINLFTYESRTDAIKQFEEAIERDPRFAEAYAALGNLYIELSGETIHPREALEKAEPLIAKSLELDDASSNAHLARGNLALQYRLEYDTAEREFKKAIQLNPSNFLAHRWYGHFLAIMGDFEGGLREAEAERTLDPVSISWRSLANEVHAFQRDWPACVNDNVEAKQAFPKNAYVSINLAFSLLHVDRREDAEKELAAAQQLSMTQDERQYLAVALAYFGRREEARGLLAELEASKTGGYSTPMRFAFICAALGEKDRALSFLEEGFGDIPASFLFGYRAIVLDSLRNDPRFVALVSKLNLPKRAWPLRP